MKVARFLLPLLTIVLIPSCGPKEKGAVKEVIQKIREQPQEILPLDRGFSEYITGYTSGIIPANSVIEIRFTPEFAAKAAKQTPPGLFNFNPAIKGKTEWTDEFTLVFRPANLLDPGKTYTGELNLSKLGEVKERLKVFPIRIQTLKKDFSITTGTIEASSDGISYTLTGELTASDYIDPREAETYLDAKLERRKLAIKWDHSESPVHKFSIADITRTAKPQELALTWDGTLTGSRKKGSAIVAIPALDEFRVIDVKTKAGENQKMDVVFSDPLDPSQDLEGLIYVAQTAPPVITINSNVVTIIPSSPWLRIVTLNVETAVKNAKGNTLSAPFTTKLDFTPVNPGIQLVGEGIILPSSQNLIFPFKAANLKAVDLKIVKIFENNLPYFLQENEINSGYYVKRFGRPVWSGRIDLTTGMAVNAGTWNMYTIDLADYIDVEPGVLYKIQLSMRKSYSLLSCPLTPEESRYEELLQDSQDLSRNAWDDAENYYEDSDESVYYSFGFNWKDRNDPCKEAYYSPDKSVKKNILASNLGLMAKKGEDNILHVMVNDLLTALPVSEVSIDVYDYQMQPIISGNTNQDGSVDLYCGRKPFLIIGKKDKDRNYLKTNDGNSLSLSSFDVSGTKPDNGIKAFIYGERDVWRPGDSIYLSVFIKDLKNDLPPDHPVLFELINPLEQRVDNQVQKFSGANLLVFTTGTPADAVTGAYRAQFKIGGATFTKRIRIETVKPNRLKINLSFPDEVLGGSNKVSSGTINVKWLNGSVARNLKTSVDYILKPVKTEFEKYSQYIFDDPVSKFYSESVNIYDATIDENGNATFRFEPGKDINAPGMLNAVFTAKVQEQGGDESIIQSTYKYAPFPVFAGINIPGLKGKSRMLFTDADNEVRIVTVDEKGKPVRSEVEVTVYKLSYRWWWESSDENLGYFISNQARKPVIRKTIITSGGEGSFTFNINKNEWGRYLIRATTPAGHSTGRILLIDWPWEYGMKGNAEGATLLTISTDKEKYNPGDEIRLSFPSPENARAIVTLENATGVVEEIRVSTQKGNTEVKIKAKPEMAPNVYAYVTVIQPHNQTINDMPVRLYGVVPVLVEDPGTRLTPQITVAAEIRSQRPFEISVGEANRRAMNYTLAVVDEGLLDITGFRTPDPWNYFFAREALGVQTWDLYDYVLGAFGGTLERIFAIGGDEAIADRSANKAKRFIPVVKFLGPFTLAPGKTNTHTLILPQYTGSVRTMVIAGSERAFGAADKSVLVRDPLMVLVTAPRVISPGEKAALPVTLFIQKEEMGEITIKAEGNELIKFEESAKSISSRITGETDTEFTFTAGEKTGIGKIKVTASGGGESAVYELEIEVRSPNPSETRAELKLLRPGEKWETSFNPFGIEGSNSAKLELSALPSINLEKRLDYLVSYPYGCSEQVTSAVFPQLWIKDLITNDEEAVKSSAENVREGINKLVSRQMASGGIAMWPGAYQPDNWITSYAGHFMLEAERSGYNIPSGFRQKWIAFQKNTAQEWRFDQRFKYSATDQAYRLFTLALAGQPDRGAMNRLRESTGIPQLAKWLLAAAFATSGRPEVAGDLLDIRTTTTEPEYYGYYYGDQIRDKAVILYTLTVLKNLDIAFPVLNELCDDLNRGSWYSTQSLGWGLFSYMKYAESLPGDKTGQVKADVTFNGEKSTQIIGGKQIWSKNMKMTSGKNTLLLENSSGAPVYVSLVKKGIPLVSGTEKVENGLSMKVEYVDLNLKPVDQRNLSQGTDFMMIVKIANNTFTYVENIALTEMVPSGWEIQNTRLYEANWGIKEGTYDYRDIKDDRVYTYFSLSQGETKTFLMILNAAYKGEFNQPAIWCEAMYKENCYARWPGAPVKVKGQ